jgi:putative MATE family efflux protein
VNVRLGDGNGNGGAAAAGRDLTTGSIPRHLIAFSLPMLAGSLLQTAYSFVNAFWVGRFLGPSALAAVTVSIPAVFVMIAAAVGLTLASNIIIAQHYGARDWKRLRSTVETSVTLVVGTSVVLMALGLVFSAELLHLVNTPSDIFAMSLHYIRIVLLSLPLSFALFLIGSMLRGVGDSKSPVYFQAVSVLLNAALDPLLMFGWAGFPRLGLNGTAWATLFSQSVAVVGLLIFVARRRPLVMPDRGCLRPQRETAGLLLRIGLPAMVQQSVVSVSMLGITRFVSAFGSTADAAFGAALRIDQIAFLPSLTLGVAVSTLAGQNLGAGKPERVGQVFWWGTGVSVFISSAIASAAITVPQVFLRIFLTDPGVIDIGVGYLRIVGFTYVLYSLMFVANGVINGAGHTLATTIISMLSLWGVRLPLAWLLSHHLDSVSGIWIAMLTSVGAGVALSLTYYSTGRWRTPLARDRAAIAGSDDPT